MSRSEEDVYSVEGVDSGDYSVSEEREEDETSLASGSESDSDNRTNESDSEENEESENEESESSEDSEDSEDSDDKPKKKKSTSTRGRGRGKGTSVRGGRIVGTTKPAIRRPKPAAVVRKEVVLKININEEVLNLHRTPGELLDEFEKRKEVFRAILKNDYDVDAALVYSKMIMNKIKYGSAYATDQERDLESVARKCDIEI